MHDQLCGLISVITNSTGNHWLIPNIFCNKNLHWMTLEYSKLSDQGLQIWWNQRRKAAAHCHKEIRTNLERIWPKNRGLRRSFLRNKMTRNRFLCTKRDSKFSLKSLWTSLYSTCVERITKGCNHQKLPKPQVCKYARQEEAWVLHRETSEFKKSIGPTLSPWKNIRSWAGFFNCEANSTYNIIQ